MIDIEHDFECRLVPGYEHYAVSADGKIWTRAIYGSNKSAHGEWKLKTISIDNIGRHYVRLWKDGKSSIARIHRLVLMAFVGSPRSGQVCRHMDGNAGNNHVDNLKWGTRKENQRDMLRHGTACSGERNPHAKLTETDVIEIRSRVMAGETLASLGKKYGISPGALSNAARGVSWSHLPVPGGIREVLRENISNASIRRWSKK